MTRHVFKYSLYPNQTFEFKLPEDSDILGVSLASNGAVHLFIEHGAESDNYCLSSFTVIGTGTAWTVPKEAVYIGTAINPAYSEFAYHVYELWPSEENNDDQPWSGHEYKSIAFQ